MSQKELARRVGVSRAMIGNYEKGKNRPDAQKAARIAMVLGKELVVGDCRIGPSNGAQKPPGDEHKQLCFEFGKDQTFKATITIKPTRTELLITTVADLRKYA